MSLFLTLTKNGVSHTFNLSSKDLAYLKPFEHRL